MTIHGAIPPEYQNVTDTNVGKMTEQEAIEALKDYRSNTKVNIYNYETQRWEYDYMDSWYAINMAIEALIFQESVVRCKDCVHRQYGTRCEYWSTNTTWFGKYVEDTDYCSYGERRDEE